MEVKQKSEFTVLFGTNLGFVCQYPLVKYKKVISRFGDKSKINLSFYYQRNISSYWDLKHNALKILLIRFCNSEQF